MSTRTASYPSLYGKVVFITGGATGIGAELVSAFARQGARVGFNDVNGAAAAVLLQSLGDAPHRPLFIECDVSDVGALQASIARCAAQFGDIDVLVNNVANDTRQEFEQVDASHFDWSMSVNLRPPYFAIQAVLPGMKRRGGGSIINIGSIAWQLKQSDCTAYAVAKSATQGLTRSLARKLGRDRIRVNHLLPGAVRTDRQVALWLNAEAERVIAEGQCLPGSIMPADVAAMALFLAADDSRMITAQDFVVDAGWT
jgi:NAD(P)-dependent dehydrogenase (short-subunit alcohol dehydrogenase family)